jgi:hypothetical protein
MGRPACPAIGRARNCSTEGVPFRGRRLALALALGAPVRAGRAVIETTESDTSVAQALATIDNCSTGLRSVRASQTVPNFGHAHQGAGSGSQGRRRPPEQEPLGQHPSPEHDL